MKKDSKSKEEVVSKQNLLDCPMPQEDDDASRDSKIVNDTAQTNVAAHKNVPAQNLMVSPNISRPYSVVRTYENCTLVSQAAS